MSNLSEASKVVLHRFKDENQAHAGDALRFYRFKGIFALDDLKDTKKELIRFGFCENDDEPSIRLTERGAEAVVSA